MSRLLIMVILLAANPNSAEGLRLNTNGFEGCLFHLVDADGGSSLLTRDLIESIATSSGGRQLWTMSTHNDFKKFGPITKSFELEERCSVNILVRREPGPFGTIFKIFGNRNFNPKAIIILVLSSHHREAGMRFHKGNLNFLFTHLFFNILGPGVNSGIEESFVFCGRCPQVHSLVAVAHPTDLLHMRESSQEMRRRFHDRTLLVVVPPSFFNCPRFYPTAFSYSTAGAPIEFHSRIGFTSFVEWIIP